jgi:RNA 2',3'-cyclic 3'-phosphodiesterase
MRLFIAMNFPEGLRARWTEGTAALRALAPRARWTPAAQMHLTVAFLGEQPESLVPPLTSALDSIAGASTRLSLAMQGLGAFPTWRRARVVWLGVEQSPALMQIADSVARSCRDLGIPAEGRPFHPHITLARLDDRVPDDQVRTLEHAAREMTDRTISDVDSLDLMASILGPGAAKHEVVYRGKLR